MPNTILITGATSGIGEATARLFAANSWRIIITGRRLERLRNLAAELSDAHGSEIHLLHVDVRNRYQVDEALDSLGDSWGKIDVLLNNAGLSQGLEPIHEANIDDWERMIDTNIKGLLYLTRKIAPIMVARGFGHIINIGSIAGKDVYLNGNVYCATKFAVEALTRAMRMDLLPYGIKVTQIAPGAVNTEFSTVRFHGDTERANRVYEGFVPLSAADVAECIWFVVTRPPHVNINDMLVMPTAQANASLFHRKT